MDTVVLLAGEAHSADDGVSAWVWGGSAFGILVLLLLLTLTFGKGRPHA